MGALSALGQLGLAGDVQVVEAIRIRLDHGYWPVRAAALKAFGLSAPHGCPDAIAAVQSRLSDSSADVRQIAVEVLVSIAQPLQREVFDILVDARESQPATIQMAIVDGLDELLSMSALGHEEMLVNLGSWDCSEAQDGGSAGTMAEPCGLTDAPCGLHSCRVINSTCASSSSSGYMGLRSRAPSALDHDVYATDSVVGRAAQSSPIYPDEEHNVESRLGIQMKLVGTRARGDEGTSSILSGGCVADVSFACSSTGAEYARDLAERAELPTTMATT